VTHSHLGDGDVAAFVTFGETQGRARSFYEGSAA
jgi:hypothetical protein